MQAHHSTLVTLALLASSLVAAHAPSAGPAQFLGQRSASAQVASLVTLRVTGTWPDDPGLQLSGPPSASVLLLVSTDPATVPWRGRERLARAVLVPVTLDRDGEALVPFAAATGPELFVQMILMPTPPAPLGLLGTWVSPVLRVRLDLHLVQPLGPVGFP